MYKSGKNFLFGAGEEAATTAQKAGETATAGIMTIINPIVGFPALYKSFLSLFKNKADADREARVEAFKEKYPAFVDYVNKTAGAMQSVGYGGRLTSSNFYNGASDPKILKLKQIIFLLETYPFRYWNLYKDTGSLTEKALAYDWLYAQPNVLESLKKYPAFYDIYSKYTGSDLMTELERAYKDTDVEGLLVGLRSPSGGGGKPKTKNLFIDKETGKINWVMIGGMAVGLGAITTLATILMKRRNQNV